MFELSCKLDLSINKERELKDYTKFVIYFNNRN